MVRGMLEPTDFFQDQIRQCRNLAARANNKSDRDFWSRLANRWENLLRAQEHGSPEGEIVEKARFERRIFTKGRVGIANGGRATSH
jgi:plasmid stabilization system protein ParE